MTTSGGGVHRPAGESSAERSPEELRADLGELRSELGQTVEELAHRADVPARAKEKKDEAVERVQEQLGRARDLAAEKAPVVRDTVAQQPWIVGGVVATLVGLLVLRALVSRRSR